MMRRIAVLAAVAAIASVVAVAPVSAHGNDTKTYEVTITNLTTGQPLTPALAATHKSNTGFFRVWRPASSQLQQIAENGNLAPMRALIDGSRRFYDSEVGMGQAGPIMPGETVAFELDAASRFNFLSWASMLICTNDGFTGVNKLKLPSRVGRSVTRYTGAYDAGTEINTEDWDNLVPPCAQLTGFGDQGGTGTSDPALAQNGVIRHHRGIRGIADLVPDVHGWRDPVAKITITRTG